MAEHIVIIEQAMRMSGSGGGWRATPMQEIVDLPKDSGDHGRISEVRWFNCGEPSDAVAHVRVTRRPDHGVDVTSDHPDLEVGYYWSPIPSGRGEVRGSRRAWDAAGELLSP